MNIREKLAIIQKISGLTQTQLSQKFGVSFVAFNNWWTGKSRPHPKTQAAIDELYLEFTGQKIIPEKYLTAKKTLLVSQAKKHPNIIREIAGNQDINDQLALKLTYHSNSIEGSSMTENDTAAVLFRNLALPNKSLTEQLEAKNHQTAWQYLLGHLAAKKEIDENLVLKLHGILMNGILADAGFYRRHGVRIVGSNVPTANYIKVPELMDKLMKAVKNKSGDIIDRAAEIHSRFEQIHPFPDGNGRIGRLLIQAMLLKDNLAPAVIRQEKKKLYYIYLNKAQIKDDYSQLQDFFCDAVEEGFAILERKD